MTDVGGSLNIDIVGSSSGADNALGGNGHWRITQDSILGYWQDRLQRIKERCLVTDQLADSWAPAVNYKELALPDFIYPAMWNPNKP